MNATQTALINHAATQEVSGEEWRKRMDAWLDERPINAAQWNALFERLWDSMAPCK